MLDYLTIILYKYNTFVSNNTKLSLIIVISFVVVIGLVIFFMSYMNSYTRYRKIIDRNICKNVATFTIRVKNSKVTVNGTPIQTNRGVRKIQKLIDYADSKGYKETSYTSYAGKAATIAGNIDNVVNSLNAAFNRSGYSSTQPSDFALVFVKK